jgi:alkaline phosphatase D
MKFAFVSCQHWEGGFYTAYEHLAEEDLDFVVHVGDYIYEGAASTGGPAIRVSRSHWRASRRRPSPDPSRP